MAIRIGIQERKGIIMAEEIKKANEQKVEATKPQEVEPKEEVTAPKDEAAEEKEGIKVETPVVEEKKEEAPKEAPKAEVKKEKPAPSGKFKDLIKEIEGLTTLELAELVKELEERFGVSAAAPMAIASAPAGGGIPGAAPVEEEKAIFTVVLTDSGTQKIATIKALREINQELGLKEAKDLADNPPKEIKKDVSKEEAEEARKKLEAAGAKVELK